MNKKRNWVNRKKASTLVEILVVMVILALMIIFSVTFIPIQITKAQDAVRKANISRITKFIEEYYEDQGCYPVSIPVCTNALSKDGTVYLDNIPCDPKTKTSYVYVSEGGECPTWYQLYGNLEYLEDKIIDSVGCREGCGPDCQFNFGRSSPNQKLNPYCEQESQPEEPEPPSTPLQYVCSPGGACEVYQDPVLSGCPDIYPDDPTCQNLCGDKEYNCHDARGKVN